MKTLKYNYRGEVHELICRVSQYMNGNMAILLQDKDTGEGYDYLTVNLEDLPTGYAYIDVNNMKGADKMAEEFEIAKPVGYCLQSGWVTYPLYCFDLEKLKEYSSVSSDYPYLYD